MLYLIIIAVLMDALTRVGYSSYIHKIDYFTKDLFIIEEHYN